MKVIRTDGKGRKALEKAIRDLQQMRARVGFFEHSKYPDGTPVAYVATIQEYGYKAIPKRPFFRPTLEEQRQAFRESLAKGARAVLNGRMTTAAMLEIFGANVAGEVRIAISKVHEPPLAMSTLLLRKRKKTTVIGGREVGRAVRDVSDGTPDVSGVSTKPLVDTGYLISQVANDVVKK